MKNDLIPPERKDLARRDHIILLLMVVGAFSFFSLYAIIRHERLNSSVYDLGIKSQVIWNTYKGNYFASSIEVEHYLGDHVQLIFLLIAPLFALWEDVKILLVLQALILTLGVIPVYRIALRRLADRPLALVFSAAYLLFPLIGFVNRFDFHPVVFTIPFFLLAYDFLEIDRPILASLFILLALSLREEVGLTVFAFGLYVVFFMKKPRLGILWAAVGLSWSLVALFVVIPAFRGVNSDTVGRYSWLGESPRAILLTIISTPSLVIHHLSQPIRVLLLIKLLLPLGFLSLLSPAPLLVTIPALTYNLLSETPSQSSIYFQYLAPVVPFLFIAAIQGSANVQKWLSPRNTRLIIISWLSLCILTAWIWDNPISKPINDPYFPVYGLEKQPGREAFKEAASILPQDAPVATMMGLGSHLALRPEFALFYDRNKLQERTYGFPQSEYLLLKLNDLRWGVNARFFYNAIETAIGRFGYEAIFFKDDVVLLKRDSAPQPETGDVLRRTIDLYEGGGKFAPAAQDTIDWMGREWLVDSLPSSAVPTQVTFDEGIKLLGYEAPTNRKPGQPFCITLYWKTDDYINEDLVVFLHLTSSDGFVQAQRDSTPAQGYYPTGKWQPGEIVADMHCLQIPRGLPQGSYILKSGLYDPITNDRRAILGGQSTDNALPLGELHIND